MVYTVTFNPAIDYVLKTEDILIGKTNSAISEKMYFGGKGINVSVVLTKLGVDTTALGYLAGFTGNVIESALAKMGLMTDFIHLDNGISRINVKIKDKVETEINGAGPPISNADLENLFKKLNGLNETDMLVLAGSVPSNLPDSIYGDILKHLREKEISIIVDAKKDLLLNTLNYKPFLIKPNIDELSEIIGKELTEEYEIEQAIRKVQVLGAKNVLVSMGGDGAVLLDEFNKIHKMKAPKGQLINSVGSGDSMVAGFLAGFFQTGDYAYSLRMGIAAGSATAFSEHLADKKAILNLFNSIG